MDQLDKSIWTFIFVSTHKESTTWAWKDAQKKKEVQEQKYNKRYIIFKLLFIPLT
jgi:hypothetical protein